MAMAMAVPMRSVFAQAGGGDQDFNKRRRRRTLTKVDPLMHREKRHCYFAQPAERDFIEQGKRVLLHAEWLLDRGNHFAVTMKIARAADDFQRNHKQEALYQKPVLRAIADEINKEFGRGEKLVTDAYNEDVMDYTQFVNSPLEDPEEVIEIPGPRATNSWDWCERTDWKGKDSGDPGWVTHMKRKDIVWIPIQDETKTFRRF
ncbi:hypothetical protein SELMODRAFT_437596 [Selaginella moellendorffii]|uniref:Uncharacterized protein n=1 Tax=Selaginella moellendorffii TaxID=88036 RepID=D8QNA0_SELML|nr:hypothetical protein SELMODRAFT_437596 [Selaginella moellendorffii]